MHLTIYKVRHCTEANSQRSWKILMSKTLSVGNFEPQFEP